MSHFQMLRRMFFFVIQYLHVLARIRSDPRYNYFGSSKFPSLLGKLHSFCFSSLVLSSHIPKSKRGKKGAVSLADFISSVVGWMTIFPGKYADPHWLFQAIWPLKRANQHPKNMPERPPIFDTCYVDSNQIMFDYIGLLKNTYGENLVDVIHKWYNIA